MKSETKTASTNTLAITEPVTAAPSPTLESLIQPLAETLDATYGNRNEDFLLTSYCPFRELEDGEILIELRDQIQPHSLAWRAVVTLLAKTGTNTTWVSGRPDPDHPLGFPLRFSLARHAAWADDFWYWVRYIVVDQVGQDLDHEAAARQIAALVEMLKDPANLVEMGAEELALF